ncbi:hypothetical protein SCP_0900420 [Sparassis crispa]|uniref:Uncharacterized protein n=1 Tax=Sparassis crispa TaxID=139825 RepID=A0A401GVB7_9APHY|nr:hypothetical protein SCP_0900420 [Sparassis crispa]GBE86165.1 hypothetical protein SCP_0900420 [Sparassis crispa]
MGHKYSIRSICDFVLTRLKAALLTRFADYDTFAFNRRTSLAMKEEYVIILANLVQLTGEKIFLPLPLYGYAQLPPDMLFAGIPRADGTQEQLSAAYLLQCLTVKDGLLRCTTLSWMASLAPHPDCTSGGSNTLSAADTGTDAERESCTAILREMPFIILACNLSTYLWVLEPLVAMCRLDAGLCMKCRHMVGESDFAVRRTVWLQLPEIMGVEVAGWET